MLGSNQHTADPDFFLFNTVVHVLLHIVNRRVVILSTREEESSVHHTLGYFAPPPPTPCTHARTPHTVFQPQSSAPGNACGLRENCARPVALRRGRPREVCACALTSILSSMVAIMKQSYLSFAFAEFRYCLLFSWCNTAIGLST